MNIMFASILGAWQVVLIILLVVILFGGKKIPELAKGLGLGIKEFKKAAKEVTDEVSKAADETPVQQTKTAASSQPQFPAWATKKRNVQTTAKAARSKVFSNTSKISAGF